jgi:hypothetical protein
MASLSRRDAGKIMLAGSAGLLFTRGQLSGMEQINSASVLDCLGVVRSPSINDPSPGSEHSGQRRREAHMTKPNYYEFAGSKGTRITYSAEGPSSQSQLSYHDDKLDLTFNGDQIRVLDTEIGQLVTVTLSDIADVGNLKLTLLLPLIDLRGKETEFNSEAIWTNGAGAWAGVLRKDVRQTYRGESLKAIARLVDVPAAASCLILQPHAS